MSLIDIDMYYKEVFDDDGKYLGVAPASLKDFLDSYDVKTGKIDKRIVKHENVDCPPPDQVPSWWSGNSMKVLVSTVFLMRDHNFAMYDKAAPILYETMIFSLGADLKREYQWRYMDRRTAEYAHEKIVELIKAGEWDKLDSLGFIEPFNGRTSQTDSEGPGYRWPLYPDSTTGTNMDTGEASQQG